MDRPKFDGIRWFALRGRTTDRQREADASRHPSYEICFRLGTECPVECRPANVPKRGHVLAALPVAGQFLRAVNLLG